MVISLLLVFFAFEWETTLNPLTNLETPLSIPIPEEAPVIVTGVKPPPPPPAPKPPIQAFTEVDDKTKTDTDFRIDAETSPSEPMPIWNPPKEREPEPIPEPEVPYKGIQFQPEFPGGDIARLTFLRDPIKYPQLARETGIQGVFYLTFVVEKEGSITDTRLLRGIGGGCDEEAIRVVALMPTWKPGYQLHKAVRVQFNLPVRFTLR